ncbi:outer membrane usher protein [Serratia proteamaculans]|uniref:outer membrane usher protein n=1 Tax=Serratia proteamaculans TaxID=28151 RepID=UPI0021785E93|nr:outer membrane usher protein [Serratia proteamaculans]CAI0968888.1 Outer membrane usher protein papC precursor [Serratia proteamaculans]CAI1710546.1 Outer membrane usher protein papC precursor [Serratia proteamaculans]
MKEHAVLLFPPRAKWILRPLAVWMGLMLGPSGQPALAADSIEFNTDVLDVKDRTAIDLSEFSRVGYMMPGKYALVLRVNKQELPEQQVTFLAPPDDAKGSVPCLTPAMVEQLGLKASVQRNLAWWNQGQCLALDSLKGMQTRADLGSGSLYLNVPQAYLEYTDENWDPPSRWDQGIAGMLFDYNVNAQTVRQSQGQNNQSLSGNGTTGANLGAWRFRADWQAQYDHTTGQNSNSQQRWDWSRYYLYRAIAALRAKLTFGEDYLSSSIFDSFRYTGASLVSDDNMLPPNLRGYAPEVTGVAKTNAKVTVSQQGRVLYETQVPAGPFRIQDLNSATMGKLDVRIQEQDGSVRTFQVDTADVPYLTRPGLVRYKMVAGKPSNYRHNSEGQVFSGGEFSWGVSNGWSLFGGGLFSAGYKALALGVGRDLLAFGALSLDATQSRAELPGKGTPSGTSWRLNYSKRFDEYDSQVTFAGYRFSERNYMSMSQYLDARYHGGNYSNSKQMYTVSLNKQFRTLGLSAFLTASHQTYWDRPANNNYNLSLSRYFDIGSFKNISLSLSAYRTVFNNSHDDGVYLGVSVPWGRTGTMSYNNQTTRAGSTNTVGYYDRIDDNNTYRLTGGVGNAGRGTASGYFTHDGDIAEVTANASYQGSQYSSLGLSMQGGATVTPKGAALHRVTTLGGTRMMVDTAGVSGVPVQGYGGTSNTNIFGKAVVSDINSYYRNSVSVDVNKLPDNVDANQSVVQGTLTEGAIGYRKFSVVAGEKAMAVIKLADGSSPPFGAVVVNDHHYQTGIVNDEGSVWLTGLNPGEGMDVRWDGQTQCRVRLPSPLPTSALLLPCQTVSGPVAAKTAETPALTPVES